MGHNTKDGTRKARSGMHYYPRCVVSVAKQEQEHTARLARLAEQDGEYRRALKCAGTDLPKVLGNTTRATLPRGEGHA